MTAFPRTLLDLAATARRSRLDHAVQRAERLDLLDLGAINSMLGRHERLFMDLVKKAGLPRLAGIDSIRLTARRVEREPTQVTARLGILLARRRKELQ